MNSDKQYDYTYTDMLEEMVKGYIPTEDELEDMLNSGMISKRTYKLINDILNK